MLLLGQFLSYRPQISHRESLNHAAQKYVIKIFEFSVVSEILIVFSVPPRPNDFATQKPLLFSGKDDPNEKFSNILLF